MHNISYLVWHRLVRMEYLRDGSQKGSHAKTTHAPDGGACADDLSPDDGPGNANVNSPSRGPSRKAGRQSSKCYPFGGDT